MPDIPSAVVIALAALAAVLAYWLAWRATWGRSLGVRVLIRGGLPLLIAAPLVAFALMGSQAPPVLRKIEGQLSKQAPDGDLTADIKTRETEDAAGPRAAAPESAGPSPPPDGTLLGDQQAPEAAPVPMAPMAPSTSPSLSPSTDLQPSMLPEMNQPRIVLPPAETPETLAPPAASNGGATPEASRSPMRDATDGGLSGAGATAPPAPAAAARVEETAWDVVPVFYGTDRAEEPNPKRLAYGSERGRRLELGRALVTVPKSHEVPQIERPWAIRIPYFDVTILEETEDPNKHFTMQEIKKLSKEDFLKLVRERLAGSARFKDQALVFVHGYNTAFDNAIYRTAQIAYDVKFDGAPFVYSWPSGGAVASYTYDRESAEAAKSYMRQFLDLVVKETGAKSISVIAHSMGNQPLLDVLKDMRTSTPEGVVISQVILAAPDVDADTFADLTQAMNGLAKGVTLYAASNDRALVVSRNFWGHYRAGDVPAAGPLVLPGVDTIDVTAVSTDAFAINHSDYAQKNELLKDIGELLQTGLRPPDQRSLKPERVTTEKGAYWRYAAQPPPTGTLPGTR